MLSTKCSNTFIQMRFVSYFISPFSFAINVSSELMRLSGVGRSLGVVDQQLSCKQINHSFTSENILYSCLPKSFAIHLVFYRWREVIHNRRTCSGSFGKVRHWKWSQRGGLRSS